MCPNTHTQHSTRKARDHDLAQAVVWWHNQRHVTMTWLRPLSRGHFRSDGSHSTISFVYTTLQENCFSPLFCKSVSKFRRFCICALCNLLQESCFEAPTWMFHGYQSEQGRKKENNFFFNYYLKFIFFCRNVLCTYRLQTW